MISLKGNILYNHSMYLCVSIHTTTFKKWKCCLKFIVNNKGKKFLSLHMRWLHIAKINTCKNGNGWKNQCERENIENRGEKNNLCDF